MKNTTIEEISNEYGCDPDKLQRFLDWVLECPGGLAMAMRKTIVNMVAGLGGELIADTISTDPDFIDELRNIEFTAQYLQEFAEAKERHSFENKKEIIHQK